jgi:hypothetical protein
MAEVTINYPHVLLLAVPFVPKASLPNIKVRDRTTVRQQGNAFYWPTEERTRAQGLAMARVIAAHEGYLPNGHNRLLSGPVSDTVKAKWDKRGGTYKSIQKSIMNELYGKDTFIRLFVRGEASAEACRVAFTNWEIEALILSIVPAGETQPASVIRLAKVAEYRSAIGMLQATVCMLRLLPLLHSDLCSDPRTV